MYHRATAEMWADVAPPSHSCDAPGFVPARAPVQPLPDRARTTRMQYIEAHARLIAVPPGKVVDE
ncbi:hypothetical protein [Streptomyces sp. NPDC002403]